MFFGIIIFIVSFFVKNKSMKNLAAGIGVIVIIADLARIILTVCGPVYALFYAAVIAAIVYRKKIWGLFLSLLMGKGQDADTAE